jgi:colanic acid/amylovoran biosynthesis protein
MWEKLIIRWTFSKANIIMAREPVSYDLLNSLNIPSSKSFLVPDLAFSYVGKPQEFAENWLTEKGIDVHTNEPLLGFTVINWGEENKQFQRQEKYENAVVMVARQFIEQYNGRVFFFTQVTGPSYSQDDRIPTRRILARLEDLSKEVFFIEQPLPPDNLKSLYGSMDIFIGTRMHSNIFALSEGVPVIAIGYQYKTMGIMKMLELESWVLDINDLEVEKLLILFQSLWRARDNVREKILRIVPSLKNDANNAGKIIYHDYYQ